MATTAAAAKVDMRAVNQARRSRAIALKLAADRVTAADAGTYDDDQRAAVAQAAHLDTPPSATTWQMVVDELALITALLDDA